MDRIIAARVFVETVERGSVSRAAEHLGMSCAMASRDVSSLEDRVNARLDLVGERIDVALRISQQLDPNLISRKLGACPSVLCASLDYLERRGASLSLAITLATFRSAA